MFSKLFFNNGVPRTSLIFFCALLVSINPIAMDLYLPTFETIKDYFNADYKSVNLTLSIFLIGSALGFVIGGSVADHIGRKPVSCCGLIIYIIASFMITKISSIEAMIFWRLIQSIGGGFVVVNATAILRDTYASDQIGTKYAMMMSIMLVTPMLAPMLGVFILKFIEWQGIFYFLTSYASLILIIYLLYLPETIANKSKLQISSIASSFGTVIKYKRNGVYQSILLLSINTLSFAMFIAIIVNSSFIYVGHFGLSLTQLSIQLAINGGALLTSFHLSKYALNKFTPIAIVKTIAAIQFILMFTVAIIANTNYFSLLFYTVAMAVIFVFNGFTTASIISIYVKPFKKQAGTASSLSSTFSLLCNGLITSLPFVWLPLTFNNILYIQLICIGCACLFAWWLLPKIKN